MVGGRGFHRRDDRRRRQARCDLTADVRTGDNRDPIGRERFAPELAHAPAVLGEPFRRGENTMALAEQRQHAIAELPDASARRGHDEIVRRERAFEVGGDLHAVRYAYAGEVLAVLPSRRDLLRLRRIADPEDDILPAVASEDRRQGRAPGPRLEHGHRHEVPTRGSTPRTMRSIFARCRMKTTAPAMTMKASVHQLKWSQPVAEKSR